MSEPMQNQQGTKPEDQVSFGRKTAYGSGMASYVLMNQGINQFANPVFNDCLGVDPRWISWVMGGSRFWDAITDPVMGNITDNTRSRWGRRRPWIALGALLCGISFAAIWLFPRGMGDLFYFFWFLIASLIFFVAFTIFSVPYMALGMEMSPDYHERTSVVAFRTVISQIGAILVSGLYWFTSLHCFADRADGMRAGGLIFGLLIFVMALIPAFWAKEHPTVLEQQKNQIRQKYSLFKSAKETLAEKPFLILIGVTVLMLLGLLMVTSLGYYVSIYHVFGGDKSATSGRIITMGHWVSQICTVLAVPVLTRASKKIGKRGTLFVTIGLAMTGSLLKWVCFTPANPWLSIIPGMIMAGGLAATWTLINAMIPDIVDADELKSGNRREGMYSAVYSWSFKLGVALSLIISGYILNWSGFDVALGAAQTAQAIFRMRVFFTAIPVISMVLAVLLLVLYPLSKKRVDAMREELHRIRLIRAGTATV